MERGTTTARANTGFAVNGTDLAQRFRAVKPGHGGDKRASNTGYKSAGTDLKEMFVDIDFVLGPTINLSPSNTSATTGQTITFTVAATAYREPVVYQWQKWNGSGWDNVGTDHYEYSTTVAGTFRCLVYDGDGIDYAVATDSVTATFYNPPSITTNPSGGSYTAGSTQSLQCAATGDGSLTFEWQKWDGSAWQTYQTSREGNLSATQDQHVWNPIALGDAGTYRCRVTSVHGTADSSSAVVTVA